MSAADAPSSAAVFPNDIAEAVAAGDALSGGLLFDDALSESSSAADALSETQVFAPTLAEAVTAAEAMVAEGGSDVLPEPSLGPPLQWWQAWWRAWPQRGTTYHEEIAEEVWARAHVAVRAQFRNQLDEDVEAKDAVDAKAWRGPTEEEIALALLLLDLDD